MRQPPILQRRGSALASLGGHGLVAALLAVLTVGKHVPSPESPLILAELVAPFEPAPEPAEIETPARAPTEPSSVEVQQPTAPEARPPPGSGNEIEREPPSEPTSAQQVPATSPEPRAEPFPPPELRVEEPPPTPVPATDPPEPRATVATDAAIEAGVPSVETPGPSRALASQEAHAVLRRLSSWTGRIDADEPSATLSWRDSGQNYTAVLTRRATTDSMGMEQLLVEVTTDRDGQRLVTDLRMNRLAFSNFAQFIDRWDPEVQIHDDLIDGRFHSNSEIRVSRERGVRPVFTGKVTVAGGDIRTDGVGFLNRRAMFPAGIETSVRRIALPRRATAFDAGSVPEDRVQRVAANSLLTFLADGTVESQALAGKPAPVRTALGEQPFYIVAAEDVELHVQGTVNGKVLVYSPDRIVIADDVRYAIDPRRSNADDYLGLVAERDVEIAEPEITGPGDVEVHASIYARNRFAVRNYRSRRAGTLVIYGSVTAGSVSATEPRFATRIEFDDRLTTMRAPGFPLSDRYELDSMSGEWRVVEAP